MKKTFASLAAALILAGCGGGGADAGVSTFNQNVSGGGTQSSGVVAAGPVTSGQTGGNPSTSASGLPTASAAAGGPEGFYNGTTSRGYEFATVILETGEFWGLYARGGAIYGVIHGNSTASGSTFTASGSDFYLPTLSRSEGSLTGSFSPKDRIDGTITATGSVFTGTYDASYEIPASLTEIEGTWRGQVVSQAGLENYSLTADVAGVFRGTVSTCSFTGTIQPRASGKAVFDTTVTFAATGCLFNGRTLFGISVINRAGPAPALFTVALLPSGTNGFLAAGTQ